MLEVHRLRHLEWTPTAIVALATSVDGASVAAARESGAIEIWKVAPGSVGWYCQLTIPGSENASISSLIWCKSTASSLGRLFSAGLDGFITEWDLDGLQPKVTVESYGGSVWSLAVHIPTEAPLNGHVTKFKDDNESDSDSDSESDSEVKEISTTATATPDQQLAVACDDGCVRLFTVADDTNDISYKKAFSRVKGRILSIVWSLDGTRIYAGGSDGCIRCWDALKGNEIYRITAGVGTVGSDLCIWSLLILRNGTLVSGDSAGNTQFWECERGTLLQLLPQHKADVLALVCAPSHQAVFSAGADGLVVLYQLVSESKRMKEPSNVEMPRGDKWTFIGQKRAHTHDVRALAVAVPLVSEEGDTGDSNTWETRSSSRGGKRTEWVEPDHRKWARPGIPMLISGGNDAKLFAYPATDMLAYHPHDVCPAPERTIVQFANGYNDGTGSDVLMMSQHSTFVSIWKVPTSGGKVENGVVGEVSSGGGGGVVVLGKKRKSTDSEKVELGKGKYGKYGVNGKVVRASVGKQSGRAPVLLAKIKSKGSAHISCSAISASGKLVAFSDRANALRLFQVKQQEGGGGWSVKKKLLPLHLPPPQLMLFSSDSSRLILACPRSEIMVIDIEKAEVIHVFELAERSSSSSSSSTSTSTLVHSPATLLCASPDGQWLAVASNRGNLFIVNLETLRQHWSVSVLDGTPPTAAVFHPGNNAVLIITTAANKIHVLDIQAKELGYWSKVNHSNFPSEILEFPGGISGLTVSPCATATQIIAYSARAMCLIDLSKPVSSSSSSRSSNKKKSYEKEEKNFVISRFKDPVLYVGYISKSSLLVVERSWLELLQQFPPPVYRHLYGT